MNDTQPRYRKFFPLIVLMAGILAYANSFQGAFILDDFPTVTDNPAISTVWTLSASDHAMSRVVADFTFSMNYVIGGVNPADYHAFNLLVHLISGLLLFGLVRRTLLLPGSTDEVRRHAPELALFAAGFWVAHPLGTSAVTYISQRYESLMAMFLLLTLYAALRGATTSRRSGWWIALSVTACALGMGCKEVMVTAPAIVLAYDLAFLSGSIRKMLSRRWPLYLGLVGSWVLLGVLMTAGGHVDEVASHVQFQGVSLTYLLTQCGVLIRYLRLSLWPVGLCADYGWPLVSGVGEALPALTAVGLLGVGTVWALWRRPRVGFLGFCFFVILAPSSSFLPRPDAAFEYRAYLPLAAVCTAAVLAVHAAVTRLSARVPLAHRASAVAGLLVLAVLCAASHFRNRVYASDETVWRDVLDKRPANLRAWNNLIGALVNDGKLDEAEKQARAFLDRVIRALAAGNYANAVAASHPGMALPLAHNQLGLALLRQSRPEEAIPHFSAAIEANPMSPVACFNRGLAFYSVGREREAVADWRAAIERDQNHSSALALLGAALAAEGEYGPGVHALRRAAVLAPHLLFARIELAWVLATCPDPTFRDGPEALRLAVEVSESLQGQSFRAFDVVAAAQAECGNMGAAVRGVEEALRLRMLQKQAGIGPEPPNFGDDAVEGRTSFSVEALAARLDLYRQGRPFRETPQSRAESAPTPP